MTRATPAMIAAAWATWKPRNPKSLGPGPAFVEAINAALAKMDEHSLRLTEDQRTEILSVATRMNVSPESVLKRAIGSYCAKFGGDGPIEEPDETNVTLLSSVRNQP